ncbi:hypothetical protein EZV62_001391 [Acer yangbiense]|uniref:Uncharacterized protein n=1 Tax=Acer yangbiense TaxID=1000413 RepID=A0A5C7IWD2_9ROSI|nr:hypothetical protein EZV62_001391 [Acer yangbiense]
MKKLSTLVEVLCKSTLYTFATLTFDQRPDYGFLNRLFRGLFAREEFCVKKRYVGPVIDFLIANQNVQERCHLDWLKARSDAEKFEALFEQSRQKPQERMRTVSDVSFLQQLSVYSVCLVLSACGITVEKQVTQVDVRILEVPKVK